MGVPDNDAVLDCSSASLSDLSVNWQDDAKLAESLPGFVVDLFFRFLEAYTVPTAYTELIDIGTPHCVARWNSWTRGDESRSWPEGRSWSLRRVCCASRSDSISSLYLIHVSAPCGANR
ncbi:hypothetical protein C8J56DRAFT_1170100 [Mycena floridula]|nr:hypothetical protein C8J56DRAFT_1170078 [Mycena floridula]KAJ7578800.1 hypothetical protein C8J56DRAFT_1170100 [Mycena floridula]